MASAVCWVSPNINGNQLAEAQLEAWGSQHQMSGPPWVPLRMWGQSAGQALVQDPQLLVPGSHSSRDRGVSTTCQVPPGAGKTRPCVHVLSRLATHVVGEASP